jgi:hypothetical protein
MRHVDKPEVRDGIAAIRVTRRETIVGGLSALFGAALMDWSQTLSFAVTQPPTIDPNPKAKSVILLWMWGGPSHLDTFDPKPAAGYDYCGPFNSPIATNADGIVINELLTNMSKLADKYSIIRGMTHGNNAHETASYIVQTGNKPGDNIVHPGIGAVVSLWKGYDYGYKPLVPPYIVLTQGLGRFSETGFLGGHVAPFITGGDPSQTRFAVEGIVAPGITDQRQQDRRALLTRLDTLRAAMESNPDMKLLDRCDAQAYDLILGDSGKVFDLTQESDAVRTKYGRNAFGQSCLAARRLVEKGVPFVAINYGGWDTHKDNFPVMRRKLPEFDKAASSLIGELSDRGLLDTTIVCCIGEFGRTPKIMWDAPWNGGRGHWGAVFSALVAGGGFKGGRLVGSSDDKGEAVASRPVYPNDLIRAICELVGIDADAALPNPQGYAIPTAPAAWPGAKGGGRLVEII